MIQHYLDKISGPLLDRIDLHIEVPALRRLDLPAHAHDRILKGARTIADISGQQKTQARHVAEAVQYRGLNRNYWS